MTKINKYSDDLKEKLRNQYTMIAIIAENDYNDQIKKFRAIWPGKYNRRS
jgi:hypothetical protein